MTVVAVELDDKVATDLRNAATSLQTPEADLVRKAINSYLRQLRMDQIRAKVRPYTDAAELSAEEDIYNEVS